MPIVSKPYHKYKKWRVTSPRWTWATNMGCNKGWISVLLPFLRYWSRLKVSGQDLRTHRRRHRELRFVVLRMFRLKNLKKKVTPKPIDAKNMECHRDLFDFKTSIQEEDNWWMKEVGKSNSSWKQDFQESMRKHLGLGRLVLVSGILPCSDGSSSSRQGWLQQPQEGQQWQQDSSTHHP